MPGRRPLADGVVRPLQPGPPHPRLPAGARGPHQHARHRRPHSSQAARPHPQAERLRPPPADQLPKICQKPTITVRPGDLGKIDKYRQDRHYLHPTWQDAYRPARANIEGLNGRAKSHGIDIADPRQRLAHRRVAQTILLALMILTINLGILLTWDQTTAETSSSTVPADSVTPNRLTPPSATATELPPPTRPPDATTS